MAVAEPGLAPSTGSPGGRAASSTAAGRRRLRSALRRHPLVTGPLLTIVGLAALMVSLLALTADDGIARYLVAAAAVVVLHVGVDVLAVRWFGPRFELGLWLSIAWLTLVVTGAAIADLLPLKESSDLSKALLEPIEARPDVFSGHPLGTDAQGLDILGGILYGGRVSLTIGVGAILIGVTVGLLVGVTAGYYRGRIDTAVSFLTDSVLAFPPLILLLAIAATFTPSVTSVTLGLSMLAIPSYIRLTRADTLTFAQREFVLSARALGERDRDVILRELVPNVLLPVASFSFLLIAAFIVAEASLSFLGLSVSRPNPTWGNMIAAGQDQFDETPHLVFVPGAVLFLTVSSLNRLGEYARMRWDPREAKL